MPPEDPNNSVLHSLYCLTANVFQENYDVMKEFKKKLKKFYFGEHLSEKFPLFF